MDGWMDGWRDGLALATCLLPYPSRAREGDMLLFYARGVRTQRRGPCTKMRKGWLFPPAWFLPPGVGGEGEKGKGGEDPPLSSRFGMSCLTPKHCKVRTIYVWSTVEMELIYPPAEVGVICVCGRGYR
jgi:hypothetical protein